jgi:hypothetical protein
LLHDAAGSAERFAMQGLGRDVGSLAAG